MKPWQLASLLVVLPGFVSGGCVASHRSVPEPQVIASDLDGDGRVERVVLDGRRDPSAAVWRGNQCLWRGVPRRWQPWKLKVADVLGDGKHEIIIGVRKSTRFFPRPHNCLFVYRFDGKTVQPLWLGSSLSKPFTDFAFANLNADPADELVSVETRPDGKQCVVAYSWNGFGFTAAWQRGSWDRARLLDGGPREVLLEADSRLVRVARGG